MAKKKTPIVVEWLGGITPLNAAVLYEGGTFQPEVLLWMGADGLILGAVTGLPGEVIRTASTSLRDAIAESTRLGRKGPTRVRVASAELAEELRKGGPALEVVCAPTPELNEVFDELQSSIGSAPALSYLSSGIGENAVAAFFRAAAGLYRVKPWKAVPDDSSAIGVTIDKLGIRDGVISVVGQMGESFGLILLYSVEAHDALVDATMAAMRGEEPDVPPHLVLHFERQAEIPEPLLEEISAHRWEVAGPSAYPLITLLDEHMVDRPLSAHDLSILEAISLALPALLKDKRALMSAWKDGRQVVRTVSVRAAAGEVEVTFRAPHVDAAAALTDDRPKGGPGGPEVRYKALPEKDRALNEDLLAGFEMSQEAVGVANMGGCELLLELAASQYGTTVDELKGPELRRILFELIPRFAQVEPAAAGPLILELRAFYTYLQREMDLEQAGACLRVLNGNSVKKLEAALADPRKFGLSKSILKAGLDAGFDTSSKEGIAAWMEAIKAGPLTPKVSIPSVRHVGRAEENKRQLPLKRPRHKGR